MKHFISALILVLANVGHAASISVIQQPISFTITNPGAIQNGQILQAILTSPNPTSLKTSWPGEADTLKALSFTDGLGIVIKTAFIVNHPVSEIAPLFTVEGHEKLVKNIKIKGKNPNGSLAAETSTGVHFPGLSKMTFDLLIRSYKTPPFTNLDKQLGQPQYSADELLTNFNMVFDSEENKIRLYQVDSNRTLAICFQAMHVRQSAIDKAKGIGINLKDGLLKKMDDEMKKLYNNLNSPDLSKL